MAEHTGEDLIDQRTPFPLWLSIVLIATPIGLWAFTFSRTETNTGRAIVAVVGALTTLVSAILMQKFVKGVFTKRGWSTGAPVANLSQAMLSGLLAGWSAFVIIPEGATQRIENLLSDVLRTNQEILDALPPPAPARAPVLDRLPGLWGEPGCAVVWRLTLDEAGTTFIAEIVETEPGLPPYRLLATVVKAEGMRLDVRGEQPAEAAGVAAHIVVEDGAIPRLSWVDGNRPAPLRLQSCEGSL
jgi:hypothetical protein